MPVYCSCTCWTMGSSWKGPIKYSLSILPSFRPSVCLGIFFGSRSLDFSEFRHGARKPDEVLCDIVRFFGKTFTPKIGETGPKSYIWEKSCS